MGRAIVGGHDLDGIERVIRLGPQVIVALSSHRGQREVKYVVIERLL